MSNTRLPELTESATDGTHELRRWLAIRSMTQKDLVDVLGNNGLIVTQSTVMRWLSGENGPENKALRVLFSLTGIKPLLFKQTAEREDWRWMFRLGTGRRAA